jgi:hypothetical protein
MGAYMIRITRRNLLYFFVYGFACIGFFLIAGYILLTFGITNTDGIIDTQTKNFLDKKILEDSYTTFPLAHTKEWVAFRVAVAKDKPVISKVAQETGVEERLLVAVLVPEQMRLYHTDRPVFKRFFEPLKVLGSQSQFSWGLFGIKEDTALQVERNLHSKNSPFYLGKNFETILSFSENDIGTTSERFARITDTRDHYYTYLYTALFIKQIQTQWEKAGYPINQRPEIIATLWNLGISRSKPNRNPQSGGAEIAINGKKYSFGSLADAFYTSDELIEIYPKHTSK